MILVCSFRTVTLSLSVLVCGLLQESEASKNIEEASRSIEVKVLMIMQCDTHPPPFSHFFCQPVSQWYWFCIPKLSEKVLDINDLLGTVSPLEKDERKEEEQNKKGAKTKRERAEAAEGFVVVLIF